MNFVLFLDKQQVIGTMRAAGTTDRDVLYARKQELIGFSKVLKIMGLIWMITGLLVSLTIILAVLGLPMAGAGFLLYWRGSKNIKIAESALKEYLGEASINTAVPA